MRPTRFQNKEMKGGGGTGVVCGSYCRPRGGGEEEEVEEVAAVTAEESLAEGRPRGSGRRARAHPTSGCWRSGAAVAGGGGGGTELRPPSPGASMGEADNGL